MPEVGRFVSKWAPEFEGVSFTGGCNAGIGSFYECAWVDVVFVAALFTVVFSLSHFASWKWSGAFRRMGHLQQREWNLELSKMCLSVITLLGACVSLWKHNWHFHHPCDRQSIDYPKALDLFLPWVIGYNTGCIGFCVSGWLQHSSDVSLMEMTPYLMEVVLYSAILENKVFGLLAAFQMLQQSRHLLDAPISLLNSCDKYRATAVESADDLWSNGALFCTLDWLSFALRPFVLVFTGPFCASLLWCNSELIAHYSHVTWFILWFAVAVNCLSLACELIWYLYCGFCLLTGRNSEELKTFLKNKAKQFDNTTNTAENAQKQRESQRKAYQFLEQLERISGEEHA